VEKNQPHQEGLVLKQDKPYTDWGWIYIVICAPGESGRICLDFAGPLAERGGSSPSPAALTGRRDRAAFLVVGGRVLLVGLLLRHLLPVRRGVEEGKPAQDRGLWDAGQRPGLPQERSLQLSVQRP